MHYTVQKLLTCQPLKISATNKGRLGGKSSTSVGFPFTFHFSPLNEVQFDMVDYPDLLLPIK